MKGFVIFAATVFTLLALAAISTEKSKREHRARCEAAGGHYYHPDRALDKGVCLKRDAVIP